jgi:hypothetical protein
MLKCKIKFPKKLVDVLPVIHNKPCDLCPSAHNDPDPEVLDILQYSHGERVKTAFPCGWNGRKYCKGYCDSMGITNEDLKTI